MTSTSQAMIPRRDDNGWTSDLTANDASRRESAVADLRDMLMRGLARTLGQHGRADNAFLEDVVQEASLTVLHKLCDFRGRARFRTWAVTIAVRTALSKMRKREWQTVSLESISSDADLIPQATINPADAAEQSRSRLEILARLKELIVSELTDHQRTAVTAELRGMPLPQIAERLGMNTNAIYKLLHDARKKLRRGLERAGLTINELHEAWA